MFIGVDLGGTNIVTSIVSKEGLIVDSISIPTEASVGYEVIVKRISESIKSVIDNSHICIDEISSIGIGIPGIADSDGVIEECPNLGWYNIDIRSDLESLVGIKVFVGNDATVACIAEAYMGSLKGETNAVLLTLGTGVGGGIIIDKKIYSGKHGIASELGHMVVGDNFYDCNCGRNGCLETFSSASGVIKYAKKIVSNYDISKENSDFAKEFYNKIDDITCKDVFDYAKLNDELAKSVIDRMVKYLVRGIVNLIITIDVEKVSIGGGVSAAGEYLIELIKVELERERIFRSVKAPEIVLATMGNDAGVIGAAVMELFE